MIPLHLEIQISLDGRSTLDLGSGLAGSKQKIILAQNGRKKSISLDWR